MNSYSEAKRRYHVPMFPSDEGIPEDDVADRERDAFVAGVEYASEFHEQFIAEVTAAIEDSTNRPENFV